MKIKRNFSDDSSFEVLFKAYMAAKMDQVIKKYGDECYNKNIADTPYESEVEVWQ